MFAGGGGRRLLTRRPLPRPGFDIGKPRAPPGAGTVVTGGLPHIDALEGRMTVEDVVSLGSLELMVMISEFDPQVCE